MKYQLSKLAKSLWPIFLLTSFGCVEADNATDFVLETFQIIVSFLQKGFFYESLHYHKTGPEMHLILIKILYRI